MSTLNEVLEGIATQIHADPRELIAYAAENKLGGYHIDEAQRAFPMGSLWKVEGDILYALVRHLKPDSIVQVGGWFGASAAHLALACKANGKGHVTSVDNGGDGNTEHGQLLPQELQEYVTLIWANGEEWLAEQPDGSIGLMFEDASHATELVFKLTTLALQKIMPGGLLVNHDAAHDFAIVGGGQIINSVVGRNIRDGLEQANAYYRIYRAEPSDCGIALTVVPGVRNPIGLTPLSIDSKDVSPVKFYEDELKGLSPDEFKRLHQNEWSMDDGQRANVGINQVGNANIESVSEPPPVTEKKPVQKRKPRTPKAK